MNGNAVDLGDPAAATAATIQRSRRAWTSLTDLDQPLATPFGEMPARQLAAIATFSAVVHGWDLAAALGAPARFPPTCSMSCARWRTSSCRSCGPPAPAMPQRERAGSSAARPRR
ncbi:hypothetical protein [Mycobacterium sp.]|uniref:hypothetical protein n=1 Tax=Mycobacterium sp. TaxID=1785 RepID=UPI003F9C2AE2